MRKRLVTVLGGMVVLVALMAGVVALAAGAKTYQFTGAVTEVDTKAKTIKVDKGGEVWEFSYDGLKEMPAKKGDRVTVMYSMSAKKIEVKK